MSEKMQDKVEVEAGTKGGKVTVSGPSAERIAAQLGDLMSPFTEIAGLAGDHLRIYRYESVSKRLRRAKELAKERGEEINAVHPKNFIPWLENASLEDAEGDDALGELWSRLLLSGGREFDSELAILTDSLKRISSEEAVFLKEITTNCPHFPETPWMQAYSSNNLSVVNNIFDLYSKDNFSRFSKADEDKINSWLGYGYAKMSYLDFNILSNTVEIYFSEKMITADTLCVALEREGLVRFKHVEKDVAGATMSIGYVEVTRLGVSLIARCHPIQEVSSQKA